GFAVLAVDYRGFGQSSDATPTEAVAYEDAEAAWDYLAKLAPGRARYVVGHSLGGAIATELARRHPDAAGLVLEATFTSVADMINEPPWDGSRSGSSSRRSSTPSPRSPMSRSRC